MFNPKRPHLEMAPQEIRQCGHPFIATGRNTFRQALPNFQPAIAEEPKASAVSISYEKLFVNDRGEDPRKTGRWYRAGRYDDDGQWHWNKGWSEKGFAG